MGMSTESQKELTFTAPTSVHSSVPNYVAPELPSEGMPAGYQGMSAGGAVPSGYVPTSPSLASLTTASYR